MNVTVERPRPCEAVLTIEVGEEQMEQAVERAYRDFARYVRVDGFRPGKAPRAILEQMLDVDAVRKHAREIVLPTVYKAAIEQEGIEPFDQGTIDEVSDDPDKPMVIKATVPLRPEVAIPDYEGLHADATPRPVTDEAVEGAIGQMLAQQARLVPTTDPAEDGDTIFADLDTYVDGSPVGPSRSTNFTLGMNMAEIDNALRGAVGGDTRETDVQYPADYADETFAGKNVHFTVRVNHVLKHTLPELTDEWTAQFTRFGTAEELRAGVRAELEARTREDAEAGVNSQLLRQVAERSKVEFPSALVDREVADELRQLSEQLKKRDATMEDYVRSSGKTMQQIQDEMAAAASTRIRNGLLMGHISQQENLGVTKDDLAAEIARLATEAEVRPGEMRRRLRDEGALGNLEDRLLQRKLFDFLRSKAVITGVEEETN